MDGFDNDNILKITDYQELDFLTELPNLEIDPSNVPKLENPQEDK